MYITAATIIQIVAVITAIGTIIGLLFTLFKWISKQAKQDEDIKSIKQELSIVTECMSAVLDGLIQQGCNHTVPKSKEKLDNYINDKAHK